jgi:hypothetical protein
MAKNIGKLGIEVELDASKAQDGLTQLVQKIELFQSSVSKFSSLALNLAGFGAIGSIIAKVAIDSARFADQMERAKKNADIAASIRQSNINWTKQWEEAGPVGKAMSLPGRFAEAANAGLGQSMANLGSALPEGYLDHVNKKLDEVRKGERNLFSAIARMVPVLSELDQLSDMIVEGLVKLMPGPDAAKIEAPVWVYDNKETKKLADETVEKTKKLLASPAELLEMQLEELDNMITLFRYEDFMDQSGSNEKFKEAIAALEKQKEFHKKRFENIQIEKDIVEQQARLDQANVEAEAELLKREQDRNAALATLESMEERSLDGYEAFVYRNEQIMKSFKEAAEKAGDPDTIKRLGDAANALLKKGENAFLRTGENQYEAIANDQKMALLELEKAEVAKNENAILVAKRRLADVTNRIANLTPEKYNVDPFSFGASVRGTTEFGRDRMAHLFPKEFVQEMDKRVEDGNRIVADKIGEGNKELNKLVELAKAKPLNINWKGAAK